MTLLTVEGTYRDGKVEVSEKPAGIERSKVLVTFLSPVLTKEPRPLKLGQFSGPKVTNEEDFRLAEWRGEAEDHG